MLHIMGFFLCWWVTVAQQAALKSSFKLCLKVHLRFGFFFFFFPSKIHFVGFKKRKKFKQGTHLRVAALLMEKALENSDKWDMTKKNLSFWTLVLLTEHFLLFLSFFFFEQKEKSRSEAGHSISADSQSCLLELFTNSLLSPRVFPTENPHESGHQMYFTPGIPRQIWYKYTKEKLFGSFYSVLTQVLTQPFGK